MNGKQIYEGGDEMNNPFTLMFGKEPKTLIPNSGQFDGIKETFLSDSATSDAQLITGVRGSGKTVMLTRLSKYFSALKDWIVVELNPETDMLEYLASSVYDQANMKFRFLKKEFSFSFQGLSISLSGEKPVSNIVTLLEQMFEVIKKKGKKVLICIDDISNNQNVKTFVQQYQIFVRKDYPLYLLMTGLYENVRSLQNEKSLTFLYRAPSTNIGSLNLMEIADSFEETLKVSREEAVKMAKLTNGYAFAYQVLGFVVFESGKTKLDENILKQFDYKLREYVYEKIYFDLPENEKKIVNALADLESGKIASVLMKLNLSRESISQYRDKLLKKGVITKSGWGEVSFALPRFKEFILANREFDY